MSNAPSSRFQQSWRDCQQQNTQLDAAHGIVNSMIWGALLWAVLGLFIAALWGLML